MKIDLLTSATVVERAVKFVHSHQVLTTPTPLHLSSMSQNSEVRIVGVTADMSLEKRNDITESR
jgi:hypothetical protein